MDCHFWRTDDYNSTQPRTTLQNRRNCLLMLTMKSIRSHSSLVLVFLVFNPGVQSHYWRQFSVMSYKQPEQSIGKRVSQKSSLWQEFAGCGCVVGPGSGDGGTSASMCYGLWRSTEQFFRVQNVTEKYKSSLNWSFNRKSWMPRLDLRMQTYPFVEVTFLFLITTIPLYPSSPSH